MKKLLLLSLCLSSVTFAYSQSWTLVWQDEFSTSIGPDWVFETGGGNELWGNNELETYQKGNAAVEDGKLVITAKKETVGKFNYTSARMKTEGKQSFLYGKMEAYIRAPFVKGTWPAFWMMGNTGEWPACGEIDIMEQVNTSTVVEGTAHWYDQAEAKKNSDYEETSGGGSTTLKGLNGDQYHLYAVEWDADSVKWFVDGIRYYKQSIKGAEQTELHQPFYLLLNLAIGGDMTGNVKPDDAKFPAKMYVDYVRVYKKSLTTGLNNGIPTEDIILYPNPASQTIVIKGLYNIELIEVYNSLGIKMLESNTDVLDVEGLLTGTYVARIHTGKGVVSKVFVKQ